MTLTIRWHLWCPIFGQTHVIKQALSGMHPKLTKFRDNEREHHRCHSHVSYVFVKKSRLFSQKTAFCYGHNGYLQRIHDGHPMAPPLVSSHGIPAPSESAKPTKLGPKSTPIDLAAKGWSYGGAIGGAIWLGFFPHFFGVVVFWEKKTAVFVNTLLCFLFFFQEDAELFLQRIDHAPRVWFHTLLMVWCPLIALVPLDASQVTEQVLSICIDLCIKMSFSAVSKSVKPATSGSVNVNHL